jgi:hypothetical protein
MQKSKLARKCDEGTCKIIINEDMQIEEEIQGTLENL